MTKESLDDMECSDEKRTLRKSFETTDRSIYLFLSLRNGLLRSRQDVRPFWTKQ
jgi:hypothetical protein